MKKNKKIKMKSIEFSIFDGFIWYFIEADRKKGSEYIKKKYDKDYECSGSGLAICRKRKDPVVWLHDKRPWVVTHEMIHAVKHIFNELGHNYITDDNDEIFAYCVDYAVRQVLK